jgi:transcriptional repressor NrdR
MVIKRDGRREPFDLNKLGRGIRSCTEKLDISEDRIDTLLKVIRNEAMKQLRELNLVAYVRFAAVYEAYNNLSQFILEIQKLEKELV